MATVSDELVERVAKAIRDNFKGDGGFKHAARAAIAALSAPEFVLPLAEEMLRESGAWGHMFDTLLDAYRAANGSK